MTLAPVPSTTLVDFADILQYVWIVYVRVAPRGHPVRGTERGGSHAGTTGPNARVAGADDDCRGRPSHQDHNLDRRNLRPVFPVRIPHSWHPREVRIHLSYNSYVIR